VTIKFDSRDRGNPPGKLADAEVRFGGTGDLRDWLSRYMNTCHNPNQFGPLMMHLHALRALDGLRLVGFQIWARPDGSRLVTFPLRFDAVNGERRTSATLFPIREECAEDRLRERLLHAYADYERESGPFAP